MSYTEQARDFSLKYDGTYIGYLGNDKKVYPFFCRGCNGNGKNAVLSGDVLTTKNQWKRTEFKVDDKRLITDFPRLGAINLKHAPVVLRRISKRQWRKALVGSVTHLFDPFYEERYILGLERPTKVENKNILLNIFNPEYYHRDVAFDMVENGEKIGAAITPEWYLGIKRRVEDIVLFKDDMSVGSFKKKGIVKLYKSASPLKEQIESLGIRVEN